MLPIQIFLLAFFLIALVKVISRYHHDELSFRAAAAWVIFWFLGGAVVFSPDSSFYVAKLLGVSRGADAILYIAVAGLFFAVFRLILKIEKLNKDITSLVRQRALEEKNKL